MFLIVSLIFSGLMAGKVESTATPDNSSAAKILAKTETAGPKDSMTEEFAIIHTDKGFLPQKLYLKAKQNVKIYVTGTTSKNTAFIIDDLNVFKGVVRDSVTEVSFVPVKEGAYSFYCPITNKKGWIIVKGE